jgi:predicted transcriptional regulator
MTKPLTIKIDETAAERLARIANDLGETPEQFAARAVATSIDSYESSILFARRSKGLDRAAAAAWLKELRQREGAQEPEADDRVPPGYIHR